MSRPAVDNMIDRQALLQLVQLASVVLSTQSENKQPHQALGQYYQSTGSFIASSLALFRLPIIKLT